MKSYLKTLVAIQQYTSRTGLCFPSISSLARDTGFCERTVRYHIKRLIAENLLSKMPRTRKNGSQTSNFYRVLAKKVARPFKRIVKAISEGRAGYSFESWMQRIESKFKWVKGVIMNQLESVRKNGVVAAPEGVFFEDKENKEREPLFDRTNKKVGLASIGSIIQGMNFKIKGEKA